MANYLANHKPIVRHANISKEMLLLLLQSAQPLVGFRPAQLTLSILSRKVLQSAIASSTSNPELGGEPGIQSIPTFATRGPQRLKRR
jgi:hypothetical protein